MVLSLIQLYIPIKHCRQLTLQNQLSIQMLMLSSSCLVLAYLVCLRLLYSAKLIWEIAMSFFQRCAFAIVISICSLAYADEASLKKTPAEIIPITEANPQSLTRQAQTDEHMIDLWLHGRSLQRLSGRRFGVISVRQRPPFIFSRKSANPLEPPGSTP